MSQDLEFVKKHVSISAIPSNIYELYVAKCEEAGCNRVSEWVYHKVVNESFIQSVSLHVDLIVKPLMPTYCADRRMVYGSTHWHCYCAFASLALVRRRSVGVNHAGLLSALPHCVCVCVCVRVCHVCVLAVFRNSPRCTCTASAVV